MCALVRACAQALLPGTGRSISLGMEYTLVHDVRTYIHVGVCVCERTYTSTATAGM